MPLKPVKSAVVVDPESDFLEFEMQDPFMGQVVHVEVSRQALKGCGVTDDAEGVQVARLQIERVASRLYDAQGFPASVIVREFDFNCC